MKIVVPEDLSGTAFINKPFRIREVEDKIRETIAKRRAGK
jgi:hypothetical protein